MSRLLIAILVFGALLVGCSSSNSDLMGKTWQWTASTTKTPASQSVVPDPRNYTIEFKSGGKFDAKADCNQVSGTWTSSGSSLTIVPGPSTMAACGPTSLGSIYVAGLGLTKSYAIQSSNLVLTTADDATMTFK